MLANVFCNMLRISRESLFCIARQFGKCVLQIELKRSATCGMILKVGKCVLQLVQNLALNLVCASCIKLAKCVFANQVDAKNKIFLSFLAAGGLIASISGLTGRMRLCGRSALVFGTTVVRLFRFLHGGLIFPEEVFLVLSHFCETFLERSDRRSWRSDRYWRSDRKLVGGPTGRSATASFIAVGTWAV